MIGDTRTAALVGIRRVHRLDVHPPVRRQPVFGRLVGGVAAGTFRMGPTADAVLVDRAYRTRRRRCERRGRSARRT